SMVGRCVPNVSVVGLPRLFTRDCLRRQVPTKAEEAEVGRGGLSGGFRKRSGLVFGAVGGAVDQASRVEQMLRTEIVARPAAAGFKFDTQEIADFAKHAVLYFAGEHALRVGDAVGSP